MVSTMTKFAHLRIPLEDVVKATNNFNHDNIIGHGGFSTTYKGQLLQSGRLMKIAAERFDCKNVEADLEFLREISVLIDLKHTNLISIVGFCDEEDKKIIVTMYEADRCLGQHLSNPNFTWTQRLRICLGVARVLSYLHYSKGRDYAIIHCNINSDTILLDVNLEAKLSGFGISIKQSVHKKDQVFLCEQIGTMGYIDPAIEKTGGVTHKSDIYSYGVVLFEMLCGRKAYVQNQAKSFLAPLAKYHYENKTLWGIICPDLRCNRMSPQSLLKYSNIAYTCINEDQAARPNMEYIADELERALELQLRLENIVRSFLYYCYRFYFAFYHSCIVIFLLFQLLYFLLYLEISRET
ncbi:receptor-like protein kinase HERK 1 [Bidens hawaiensis]|uniref:receptor-like protein kinase HERK 1 n=1 Tax=Bidens hawaiensis TaxID=980011 RepID=UPI00404A390B